MLFCGLTHPEATAATRWTSFELASEMRLLPIPAADLSQKGICLSCVACRAGAEVCFGDDLAALWERCCVVLW